MGKRMKELERKLRSSEDIRHAEKQILIDEIAAHKSTKDELAAVRAELNAARQRHGTDCWAVLKRGKVFDVFLSKSKKMNEDRVQSILAWAWASGSRREYSAGIVLPRDYYKAVRCGYRLVRATVVIGKIRA